MDASSKPSSRYPGPPLGGRAPPSADVGEMEERFRATFDQAAVGMAHVGLDGRWLRVNQRLCGIVGYDYSELLELTFQDITHPDDLARDLTQARRLLDGAIDSYAMEKRYIRKDGSQIWIDLTVSLLRDRRGAARYFIAVVQDISRRKDAEEELARHHEALDLERRRLRTVMDLLPAGVWIADTEGRIVDANRGAAEIWGGEAPVSGASALYHGDYPAFWPDGRRLDAGEWGLARAVERGERSGPEEVLIECFDGTRKTILNHGIPIRNDKGEVEGAVALSVDITEAKRTEAELRAANDRLTLLVRSASGLLASERPKEFVKVLFDDLATHLGVAVYFNYMVVEDEGGTRLRLDSAGGVPAETIDRYGTLELGNAVCGTVAVERRRIVLENVQESDDPIASVVRSLGVTAYVCHPLTANGELVGTLSFGLRDRARFEEAEVALLQAVSDNVAMATLRRRSREAERQARMHAEEANRARADFMATVSHELRTPLNAIIGYTQLLEEGVPTPVGAEHLRSVKRIRYGAQHLQQLIDEILTFSRLEAGQERVEADEVRIEDLLNEVRAVIEPLALEKSLSLTVEADGALPALHTDPRKLRQILLNLLGNATKFTAEGEVGLRVDSYDGATVFTVRDTGIGIAEEDLERLFEPFWQADPSTTRRAGGTGLGLTICLRYVELLGASLSVESTRGEGSTFRLEVPRG